jgi:DnaJ family protein C protein 8
LALRIKDEEKRVTEEEKAEAAQRKQEYKERKEWESEDRREARVGGWRDFMKGKKTKKAKLQGEFKPPSLKVETNEKDKKAFALERDRVLRPDELKKAF